MDDEQEYVLGTHDEEITRLGLQHRVWRPRALDAWIRAGFTTGQTLVDAGCGPGYATIDLAAITGPSGRVVAIDKSPRFLDALRSNAVRRNLTNIDIVKAGLDDDAPPAVQADGIWIRLGIRICQATERPSRQDHPHVEARRHDRRSRILRLLDITRHGASLHVPGHSRISWLRSWPVGGTTAASPISAWTCLAG